MTGGRSDTDATSTGSAPAEDLFSTVSLGRVSSAIVDQIKGLIREGRLNPGDRLPSERELCERFGVSRVTVREALRILETNGLITIKVGARGGALVARPTSDQVGANLAELVGMSPLTAQEVTEARLVFEVGMMPLVVQRATDEDIAALRAMTTKHAAALRAGEYTMEMSAEFHVRLAACTHNTAIEMLVRSFEGPLLMSLVTAKAAAPLMGRKGGQEHAALIDAIADRDVERAETIMLTHLRRTARRVARTDAAET
ncbi:FadR/GntR family transcriptional regulator [Actinophytocola sp.]|uniref:FadR/GntR family transcriptional regulator n=1 Tax=Actinophytocola sp. TaxID=1872138 RepID=UPI003D6A99A1